MTNTTHFGYKTVSEDEKVHEVAKVFHSVAAKYDIMNDVMSGGLHRVWKAYTVGVANVQPGDQVLDIAGGTGDLARAFAARAGDQGCVVLSDINESMLRVGRDRRRCVRRAGGCSGSRPRRGPSRVAGGCAGRSR